MGESQAEGRRGPRGGSTTIMGDKVRKNFWITLAEAEALRLRAFETRRTETTVIRAGLRCELGLGEES